MTDLLDRPAVVDTPATSPATPVRPAAPTSRSVAVTAGHGACAAALAGAAAIHFAMAPSHLAESAVEGAGFIAAAWAQAVLAVTLLRRPTRMVLAATAAVGVVLVAAWVASRTLGLPFGDHAGHAETVALVDGICVGLEVAATLLALLLLFGLLPALTQVRSIGVAGSVVALAVTTWAIASPSTRDHATGSHGDHRTEADAEAGAEGGAAHEHGAAVEDDLGFAALSNGHQHQETPNEPLTPEQRVELTRQLGATTVLVEKYPTLGAAEAAGWKRAGPFAPGLGTHYRAPGGALAAGEGSIPGAGLPPPMLVFDGVAADAPLAGFMYLDYSGRGLPEGFAGPNDIWHYHEHTCIVFTPAGEIETPFGADDASITQADCSRVGGTLVPVTGYMVHVWNVAGYESPDGMFTELNRRITCPDGTYHRIPSRDVGSRTTVCLDP